MSLDLIAFFVPPVLGVLAKHAHRAMTGKTHSRALALLALITSIAYVTLAFRIPFRALWLELVMAFTGTCAVMLILIAFPFDEKPSAKPAPQAPYSSDNAGCACAAVILLLPFVSFTMVGRVNHASKVAAEWNGRIAAKYRSHNHASPSFTLSDATEIEGIHRTTWERATVGSRLAKSKWSAFGEIDGRRVRIVQESKVMFLGPFPD